MRSFVRVSGAAAVVAAAALLAVALLAAACSLAPNPAAAEVGSLAVAISDDTDSRTLIPDIDMHPTSYVVTGTGPGGASFLRTVSGGAVIVEKLRFGEWTVLVEAKNKDGTVIGSGRGSATVRTGQTTPVWIFVRPLSGFGTLSLEVLWPSDQVEKPVIEATLTPAFGSSVNLTPFDVSPGHATFSKSDVQTGYHTLTLRLLDRTTSVMGAVEVVRIVKGQVTSGRFEFSKVNAPGGTIAVFIVPQLADPLEVTIIGAPTLLALGSNFSVSAGVPRGTGNVVFIWYLNGGLYSETGPSWTFGSALRPGYYELDVTAFTADGKRAGSDSAFFTVE